MLMVFSGCPQFHILQLLADRVAPANSSGTPKASTFDNGDGKPKSENPLLHKDLTDSIQVIS
jgi:hypothetical protein